MSELKRPPLDPKCFHEPLLGTITPIELLDDGCWVSKATCTKCRGRYKYARRPVNPRMLSYDDTPIGSRVTVNVSDRRTTVIVDDDSTAPPDALSKDFAAMRKAVTGS